MKRILLTGMSGNGKRPEELAEVLHNLATVEPLLRRGATHEVDTTAPPAVVVARTLALAGAAAAEDTRQG